MRTVGLEVENKKAKKPNTKPPKEDKPSEDKE